MDQITKNTIRRQIRKLEKKLSKGGDRMERFNNPLGKIIIEALRFAVLAGISVFIQKLSILLGGVEQTQNVVALTLVLRFIDSALHKSGFAEKGLVRF